MYFHVDHYGGVSQGYQSGLWSVACHTFSDRSRMSGCRWRYGSGPVGGDTHKSPSLASSCLHSLLQTSRAWTALSFSPRLASGQELHGRQEKHGAAEILAFHPHTAHLQQAFAFASVGPKKYTQQGYLKMLTSDHHAPGVLSVKDEQS